VTSRNAIANSAFLVMYSLLGEKMKRRGNTDFLDKRNFLDLLAALRVADTGRLKYFCCISSVHF
jgi:hypothetical protein